MTTAEPTVVTFSSEGIACEGWHYRAAHDALATASGRPLVVMAHGFGGTKDSGLQPFAEALASAGMDVLTFDYRGFGGSAGSPRQWISLDGQAADYRAALTFGASLPEVDPHRLILWGVSLSGGTVLEVAAGRSDIAALVALTPLVSGPAAAVAGRDEFDARTSVRTVASGLRSHLSSRRGRPTMIPIVGEGNEPAVLPLSGMKADYLAIAGPTWRNEVDARIVLDVLTHRPNKAAGRIGCPALFQIADHDRCAPPQAAMQAAFKALAVVHHYPGDHFDVYRGKAQHAKVVADQVQFLTRALSSTEAPTPSLALVGDER